MKTIWNKTKLNKIKIIEKNTKKKILKILKNNIK